MNPGGVMRLVARRQGRRIVHVEVDNPRPQAARVLVGRTVEEALKLVPTLFSLCSHAQRIAATAACVAAGATQTARPEAWAEERELATEMTQEHLWRLMLDWPTLFGHAPRRDRFAELHRRLARLVDARAAYELGGDILDLVAVELLQGFFMATRGPSSLREFVERARRGGTIGAALGDLIEMGSSTPKEEAVPLLPMLSAGAWANELGGVPSADFCATPTLFGKAHETGVLSRHAGELMVRGLLMHRHRIAARLFARVVDLSECASRLRHPLASDMPKLIDAAPLGEHAGLACVETARGLLMHAVRLDGERIAEYAIVAPTEWNFHADGPFVREGCGWETDSDEAALLRLKALALSLDPCVEYQIAIEDVADA
ncbi:nickel-dependent hydrogenase large subunit [Aromatoleum evansii]|uniref:Nickel-dependent hydrogenase large subunit n=1 Tax=Aromatoleum evansii TaxID=59406 RepID=A0ABZ1AKM8_AROEV|nr:nickel-dependent hydrogenase large subunit [Aromatoleum evansii]